jgi:hypothetical protein
VHVPIDEAGRPQPAAVHLFCRVQIRLPGRRDQGDPLAGDANIGSVNFMS